MWLDRVVVNPPSFDDAVSFHDHVLGSDPLGDKRGQTLSRVFVEEVQNPKEPAVVCPIRHEVRRPDVRAVRGPQLEARPLVAVQSTIHPGPNLPGQVMSA